MASSTAGPVASPSSSAGSTTRAEAAVQAERVATDWVGALHARDYRSAWDLLSDESRQSYGSLEKFASDRAAFMDTAKGVVLGPSIDADPRALADWLPAAPGANAGDAFLAMVEYPMLRSSNNDQEILVVATDRNNAWRI